MIREKTINEKQCIAIPWRIVIIVLLGFVAAWISGGSIGLLAHPLRRVLVYVVLGIILFSIPLSSNYWRDITYRLLGCLCAAFMLASNFLPINILAVAVFFAFMSTGLSDSHHCENILLLTSSAIALLGIFRLACVTVPAAWLGADRIGKLFGIIAGVITRTPLWIGSTFAGLDFLILLVAFFCGWLLLYKPSTLQRKHILYGIGAILIGHFLYLVILSLGSHSIQKLTDGNGETLLWYFPQIAAYIHCALAAFFMRRLSLPENQTICAPGKLNTPWIRYLTLVGLMCAVLLAMLTTLYSPSGSMRGCKIVVYEHGFLNWLKPRHGNYGRLSVGMYGMMPAHIESLGGRCVISPDLSDSDLAGAQVLILLYPNEPWPKGMLDRIWKFVEDGGSLLVMGEHTVKESDGGNRFNDVLAPTNMRVRFDSATFAIGGWLHSYQSLSHPALIGINDDRNQFGVVIGASVDAHFPARPLLIGRWGWADPGDIKGSAMMGNGTYDPGEKLGDLILAAEQKFGKGKIIVFGDTSGITNGIVIDTYPFVHRLYAYLANHHSDYQPHWRQVSALFISILFMVALLYLPGVNKGICIIALAIGLAMCQNQSVKLNDLLPDGRLKNFNNIAYIDSSHLPASSEESWRDDGLMGLALTLMRNDYLVLGLPELSRERLERAGMLVLVAPRRSFTKKERTIIYDFVKNGGILICTVGYEDCGPIRPLLSDFECDVGFGKSNLTKIVKEPQPLGYYKAPYLNAGGYLNYVRFHAAWPISSSDPTARVMAYGRNDVASILLRRVGHGKVVLIGDTSFAMNKNLEHQDGSPFEGIRENAHFWRWFITVLRDEPQWIPPNEYTKKITSK